MTTSSTPETPRTEAGRALAADFITLLDGVLGLAATDRKNLPAVLQMSGDGRDKVRESVIAIEAEAAREARAATLREVREKVDRLVGIDMRIDQEHIYADDRAHEARFTSAPNRDDHERRAAARPRDRSRRHPSRGDDPVSDPMPAVFDPSVADLLNSLGIVGPNIRHEEQIDPDPKWDEDERAVWELTKDQQWCVCGRLWPCEAQELGERITRALERTSLEAVMAYAPPGIVRLTSESRSTDSREPGWTTAEPGG